MFTSTFTIFQIAKELLKFNPILPYSAICNPLKNVFLVFHCLHIYKFDKVYPLSPNL